MYNTIYDKGSFFKEMNKTSLDFYSTDAFTNRFRPNSIRTTTNPSLTAANYSSKLNKRRPIIYREKVVPTLKNLDNFHHEFLSTKLKENSNLKEKRVFLTSRDSNNFLKKNYKSNLLLQSLFLPIRVTRYSIFDKNKPKRESINQFLEKSKMSRKNRIINGYIQNNSNRFNEGIKSLIQEKESNLYLLKKITDIYEFFSLNTKAYLKFLEKELQINRELLNNLVLKENEFRTENTNLYSKIEYLNKKISKGKRYRNLFLCIKFKVKKIVELPQNILDQYHINEEDQTNKNNNAVEKREKSIVRKSFSPIKRKRSFKFAKKECSKNNNRNENKMKLPEVFTSTDELDQCLVNIQNKTLKFINVYNDIKDFNKNLNKERLLLLSEFNKNEEIEERILEDTIKYYEEVKKKNEQLNDYHDLILINVKEKCIISHKLVDKIGKILILFQDHIKRDFPYDNASIKILLNKNKKKYQKGSSSKIALFGLKLIEKYTLILKNKHDLMKNDQKNSLLFSQIKYKLDLNKKTLNSKIKEKEERERRQKLNERIYKRFTKTFYFPNKRLGLTGYSPVNEHFMKKKNNKNLSYFNLLSYDLLTY